jgi:hypothetical protein
MRVVLNIAAMVLASSLGFAGVLYAADDEFGARFADDAPNAFGDPADAGVNYDAFAMDDATAAMLNDMMPAAGDEAEGDEHSEDDHAEDAHDEEHHEHHENGDDEGHEDDSDEEDEDEQDDEEGDAKE